MLHRILLDPAAAAGTGKPGQADIVTQNNQLRADIDLLRPRVAAIEGDKTKLVAGAILPTDLVSAANTIFNLTAERDAARTSLQTEQTRANTLTGDKTQLKNGATLPVSLVEAANDIHAKGVEIQNLKDAATTVDRAVAVKLAQFGIQPAAGGATQPGAAAGGTAKYVFNPDAKILEARGVKTLDELNAKCDEARAKQAAQTVV